MQDLSEDRGFRVVPDVLGYDPVNDVWIRQGQMKLPRMSHGASAVAVSEDIMRACRTERTVRDNSVYGVVSQITIYCGSTSSSTGRDVDHRRLPRSSQPDGPEVCRAVDPLQ